MSFSKTQAPGACHLLRVPLELRDTIYGMLLTTPYCTEFDTPGNHLKFHIHSAILLVNKQICAEAMKVLYQGNHFVILKTTGMGLAFQNVPEFKLLTESKVKSPVLPITAAAADSNRLEFVYPQTLLTTLDGLQPIIIAIWRFADYDFNSHKIVYNTDLSLTLNYNPKVVSRYHLMNDLVLRPWSWIHGLRKLVLIGNIEESLRENLQKSNIEGPFPGQVATNLTEYHSLAEREFERINYSAARWWCTLADKYWDHIVFIGPYHSGGRGMPWQKRDELYDVLTKSHRCTMR